jgi:iron complex transport system ATP-binding protein
MTDDPSSPSSAGGAEPKEILRVEDLACGYGGEDVLRGVSLAFHRGEMVGLIGPNGAGKTTLFRAVSGALPPSRGAVFLSGRSLHAIPPAEAALRMASTPQVLDVPFSFSVEAFVGMGRLPHLGRFSPMREKDREIVRRVLALMDLLDFGARPLNTLSGGERQRAIIAQALAQEPELLLLDEPAAHLDINHQVEVFELLHKIRAGGPAVVVVLHDLNLAAEYCERIILLKEGRVSAEGTPGEVITSKNLAGAFGVRLEVAPDPQTHRPVVHYRRVTPPSSDAGGTRVHVLCGGGTGATLLRRLHLEGFTVTTGVLNEGDSDLAYARSFGIPAVVERPFIPVGEEAAARTAEMMEGADMVVITAVPFGSGNVRNLTAIPPSKAARVLIVASPGERDFTGGEATALLDQLFKGGARGVASNSEVLESIQKMRAEG